MLVSEATTGETLAGADDELGAVSRFGFSGHGFKPSPDVGRVLAQETLGLPTDVSLAPYSIERFDNGKILIGNRVSVPFLDATLPPDGA